MLGGNMYIGSHVSFDSKELELYMYNFMINKLKIDVKW